jgi:hypothetical protein
MPSLWAILVLAGCCASSMVITYRARAAQADADKPAATAKQETPASKDTPSSKDTAGKDASSKDSASKDSASKDTPTKERPPPSKPEESATIEDDPTLVPDSKESADNNVTFPIDI